MKRKVAMQEAQRTLQIPVPIGQFRSLQMAASAAHIDPARFIDLAIHEKLNRMQALRRIH